MAIFNPDRSLLSAVLNERANVWAEEGRWPTSIRFRPETLEQLVPDRKQWAEGMKLYGMVVVVDEKVDHDAGFEITRVKSAPKPPGAIPGHLHQWSEVVAVRESKGVQVTVYGCASKTCFETNR